MSPAMHKNSVEIGKRDERLGKYSIYLQWFLINSMSDLGT